MIERLGNVFGWAGDALTTACLFGAAAAWRYGQSSSAVLLLAGCAAAAFTAGRAIRYVLRG